MVNPPSLEPSSSSSEIMAGFSGVLEMPPAACCG
jgi:hypothetical protein